MLMRFCVQSHPSHKVDTLRYRAQLVERRIGTIRVSNIVGADNAFVHRLYEFQELFAAHVGSLLGFRGYEEESSLSDQGTLHAGSLHSSSVSDPISRIEAPYLFGNWPS